MLRLASVLLVILIVTPAFAGDEKEKEIAKNVLRHEVGIDFVEIKAGTFIIGLRDSEGATAFPGETPAHEVKISKGFWISRTEITQKVFKEVCGYNPSFFSQDREGFDGSMLDLDLLPVESVTWYDAIEFCNALSDKDGIKKYYILKDVVYGPAGRIRSAMVSRSDSKSYRLPTSAEWEYACRSGTVSMYNIGNRLTTKEANINEEGSVNHPLPVGHYKQSNKAGLFDMHGNVSEWCEDWADPKYYELGIAIDPRNDVKGIGMRVTRGGSWSQSAIAARSSFWHGSPPTTALRDLGFRIVCGEDARKALAAEESEDKK